MTSRERILSAIRHEPVDRTPVDLGAMRSTGIAAMAMRDLRKAYGLPEGTLRLYDLIQQLAYPEDDLLDIIGADVVDFGNLDSRDLSEWRAFVLPDKGLCVIPNLLNPVYDSVKQQWELRDADDSLIGVRPDGCMYFEQSLYPLADGNIPADIPGLRKAMHKVIWDFAAAPPWHRTGTADLADRFKQRRAEEKAGRDRAIMLSMGCNLLEWAQFLMGNENFFMMLGLEPEKAEALLDLLTESHLENIRRLMPLCRGQVDIIQVGDDLGMQTGLQISPQMYRDLFKPRHSRIYHAIKELSGCSIFLHSCGSVTPIIGDLIEAGVDILNPVQTSAKDMEPAALKKSFGKNITFWGGGCDTQTVLSRRTPADVAAMVHERVDIFGKGSGFVFNQVHNIMANVPTRNIVAMYDALKD